MSETNYTIPGMEIALEDGNFGYDAPTGTGDGILLIGPSDAGTSGGTNYSPILIQSLSVFGKKSPIGSYTVENALARGYKQLKDTCTKPIYAISLPANCIVSQTNEENLDAKRVSTFMFLNELFNVIKDNSSYERCVLKNVYSEVYDFEATAVSLGLFTKIGTMQSGEDTVDIAPIAQYTTVTTTDDAGEDVSTSYLDLRQLLTDAYQYIPTGETAQVSGAAFPEAGLDQWLAVIPGEDGDPSLGNTLGYVECIVGTDVAQIPIIKKIYNYSFIKIKTNKAVTGQDHIVVDVVEPKMEVNAFLNLNKKANNIGLYSSEINEAESYGVFTNEDLAKAKPIAFKIDELFAQFCLETTLTNSCMIGYMSVRPPEAEDLVGIRTWVAKQSEQNLNGYLQKCATLKAAFALGNSGYYDTIEAAYAGTDAALPSNSSTTNKQIKGLNGMFKTLSASQISKLAYNNLVTLRCRNGEYYIADGVTTAGKSSDYTRLTTVKIANDVIKAVRDVSEPYIGEPNTIEKRNALSDQIEEMLDLLRADGIIQAFKSQVLATDQDILDGNVKIALSIVPVFELRRINLIISLRPSL
jgi:hypothetical protein